MGSVERFEDLIVWKDARNIVGIVYSSFSNLKDFGFRDQIQRASVSIMNNISEGFERGSNAEFIRFLFIAKASAGEVRSMVYLALDLKYIDDELAKSLINSLNKLSGSIANFIKYLKTNSKPK